MATQETPLSLLCCQHCDAKNTREDFVDPSIGTLLDGYATISDLVNIFRFYFGKKSRCDLRNRMYHFLCHACLLRDESARSMELPDLFCVLLENEEYSEWRALALVMDQCKTNQFGKRQFGSCFRHRNVNLCPIRSLASFTAGVRILCLQLVAIAQLLLKLMYPRLELLDAILRLKRP